MDSIADLVVRGVPDLTYAEVREVYGAPEADHPVYEYSVAVDCVDMERMRRDLKALVSAATRTVLKDKKTRWKITLKAEAV